MAKFNKNPNPAPNPKPVTPAVADTPAPTPAVVEAFNPATVDPVSSIPSLADSGLEGNALVIRINPKAIIDINTPEKLYEHARAAWSGKDVPSTDTIKHVVVMTKEVVKMPGADGKAVNELKTSVLAVYDVTEFHAFTEADVSLFTERNRSSFCKVDKDGNVTTDLLEKRWIFTGTLNEKATKACKGLFWQIPFGMFWKIKTNTPEQFLTESVALMPPAKQARSASSGPVRDFTAKAVEA